MGIHAYMDISRQLYICFYEYPFGYPWISMDIHALICYGFSIQGLPNLNALALQTQILKN